MREEPRLAMMYDYAAEPTQEESVAVESPNGLFLITFLLNGISEEGIRLDLLSHREPSGRTGKGS